MKRYRVIGKDERGLFTLSVTRLPSRLECSTGKFTWRTEVYCPVHEQWVNAAAGCAQCDGEEKDVYYF